VNAERKPLEAIATRLSAVARALDLAMRWPQFSERELARLRFLLYRRQMRRIRPPAPVRVEVDTLCASLLATSVLPDPKPPKRPIPGGGVLAGGRF
jgi:hypothetical protein